MFLLFVSIGNSRRSTVIYWKFPIGDCFFLIVPDSNNLFLKIPDIQKIFLKIPGSLVSYPQCLVSDRQLLSDSSHSRSSTGFPWKLHCVFIKTFMCFKDFVKTSLDSIAFPWKFLIVNCLFLGIPDIQRGFLKISGNQLSYPQNSR